MIVKLQLIAVYYVLFLKFITIDQGIVRQMLEAFGNAVSQNKEFDLDIVDSILDVL